MTAEDLGKLQKLMQMTFSPNENERLISITKANEILTENKLNWDDFFKLLNVGQLAPIPFDQYMSEAFKSMFSGGMSGSPWFSAADAEKHNAAVRAAGMSGSPWAARPVPTPKPTNPRWNVRRNMPKGSTQQTFFTEKVDE